ncbi:MAG: ATPase [Oleibacter sp.]|nr:ATPase [Thalassolituus sp.]
MSQDQTAIILVIVAFVIFIPFLIAFTSRAKLIRMQRERDTAISELEAIKGKYGAVIDADAEARKITEEANLLKSDAEAFKHQTELSREGILSNARSQAEEEAADIIEAAKQKKRRVDAQAAKLESTRDGIISQAKEQALSLVSSAREEAERIAGDAFRAKEKADIYKAAVTAMRNQIEGYRDDYIIPNQAAIDDLAEDFGHKAAGQKLKDTRAKVKMLVKEQQAATCDYAEIHRRATAILFVLDAFNGKVDSVLAKVKNDNYGKLVQEIKDAFALVNKNGAAFRNARIEPVYLKARQEELRWAVAVKELQMKEREEQRVIREQMREEEKARREIEKAIKEAEKEERMLAKALKEAKAQLASAHDDEKAEYEAKLAELQDQLIAAEERGQRAISMAEQTRRGHVYVISNIGSFGENVFKIGMTRRLEPLDRVKELGDASVPFEFDVHAMIFSEDAPTLEKELHRHFQLDSVNKVNPRKEFFGVSLPIIRQKVEQMGMKEVHWTMKADAAEYRESLAISREVEEVSA